MKKILDYTFEEACQIGDQYEATGTLPEGMTKDGYKALMHWHGLAEDEDEDFIDPAGGSGLASHI